MPTRKKSRLEGWDYNREGVYFLTICAKDRAPIFSRVVGCGILDAPRVELTNLGECVQDALLFLAERKTDIHLVKWVIMPNHVHVLLSVDPGRTDAAEGQSPANQLVPKVVSSLKRFTNRRNGKDLWQTGYHDHIVRNESDFLRIWQYIDNNPAAWLEDCYYI